MVGGRAADASILQRVVQLGPCSAVLVSEHVLVTSAHCLAFPVREIHTNGEVIPIASCSPHSHLSVNIRAPAVDGAGLGDGAAGAELHVDAARAIQGDARRPSRRHPLTIIAPRR